MADNSNSNEPGFFSSLFDDLASAIGIQREAPGSDGATSSRFRPLTSGEIDMSEAIFGNSIDYTKVTVTDGGSIGIDFTGQDGATARAFVRSSSIFFDSDGYSNDFSGTDIFNKGVFVHEMTHVFQTQNGIDPDNIEVELDLAENGGNPYGVYEYKTDPNKGFLDYNNEQQAEIAKDYYFDSVLPPSTPEGDATVQARRDVLPFDIFGGELLDLLESAEDDAQGSDGAPANTGNSGAQPTPAAPAVPSQAGPDAPGAQPPAETGSGAAGPLRLVDAPSETPSAGPSPEPAPTLNPTAAPDSDAAPGPTLGDLTGEPPQGGDNAPAPAEDGPPDFDDRSADEIFEELEAALRDEPTNQDDDSEPDDGAGDEDEPETDGSSEMPNPIDDGPSYVTDFSVLVNRNAPYVNPGSGDFDLPDADGDIFDLLNRNAPATNPGPGDFDMPAGSTDFSVLLNRNAPVVNPGLIDFDLPVGDGDLSDLLNRNGPRQAPGPDAADLPDSAVDSDLSDFDFGSSLEDFAGLDIA
jgi:hypothetical protein